MNDLYLMRCNQRIVTKSNVRMNGRSMGEEEILVENDFTMPTSFPVLGKLLGLSNDDAKDILLDPWDRSHGNGKWNQKVLCYISIVPTDDVSKFPSELLHSDN